MNKLADSSGAQTSSRREKCPAATSGVLIPSRRSAKRPSAVRHPCRAYSSAQIRSTGAKRKHSTIGLKDVINCYWWTKRARSALGGGRTTCTRDWANIGYGPAGVIAELALASDVADYVRFRAVCRPWRQCSPDPRAAGGLDDARFLPRRWILLDKPLAEAGPCLHRFVNVSTGECIRMGLPEISEGEHRFLAVTPEGLLLLCHEPTMIARLLNPLTRQLVDLPPLTAFVRGDVYDDPEDRGPFVKAVGLIKDSTVAVSFCGATRVAFAKPGDDSWTVANGDKLILSALAFAGRFYCATYRGVMVLNTTISSEQQQQPPKLTMVADVSKSFRFSPMTHTIHLVDNGGELMLLHRPNIRGEFKKYNVYRLDFEAGILIPVKSLNGRAMFMGMLGIVSVPVLMFLYVTADTIYLGDDWDATIEEYNIADESRCNRIYDGSESRPGLEYWRLTCLRSTKC